MKKLKVKTIAATALMITAMSSVVAAGDYSKTNITVTDGSEWLSTSVKFNNAVSHTASISLSKISHKGDCDVSIVGGQILGHRISYASHVFELTTGSLGGNL